MIENAFKIDDYTVNMNSLIADAVRENNVKFITVTHDDKEDVYEKHIFETLEDLFNFSHNNYFETISHIYFIQIETKDNKFYYYVIKFNNKDKIASIINDMSFHNSWRIYFNGGGPTRFGNYNIWNWYKKINVREPILNYYGDNDFFLSSYSLIQQLSQQTKEDDFESMIQYINEDIEVLKSARIHQHKDIVVVYKKPTALTALKKIDDLTGLHTVKERLHELQKFNAINQLKKKKGIATPSVTMHLVFTGNPGTGKTTVARILGEVYHSIGLLDSGQTIMVNALDLLAKYVGQTAPKVEETFNHALGGVLFIDEAYALKQTRGGYGEEAIAKLIQLMEENRNDVMVIMAGYEKEMMDFLQMNPGLRERFTEIIHFEDYNKEELKTIYIQMLKEQNYSLTEGALLKLDVIIEKLLNHGKFKSNARSIRNMVDKTFINQSVRLHDAVIFPKDAFLTITAEDIPSSFD